MTVKLIQRLIAIPFLVLGAWCLLAPASIEKLSFTPQYQTGSLATYVIIGCFGAQAMLGGLFIVFSRFTRWTFLAYGIALLPFFFFNYWFVIVVPVFTHFMLVDFAANLVMLFLCWLGWQAARREGV
jgi:hypothetical protein